MVPGHALGRHESTDPLDGRRPRSAAVGQGSDPLDEALAVARTLVQDAMPAPEAIESDQSASYPG